jgi:hypothetical protein
MRFLFFYRLVMGLVFCVLVYYTPLFAQEDGQFPMSYYTLVLIIYAFHQVIKFFTFSADII